jgi:hypothetical protein
MFIPTPRQPYRSLAPRWVSSDIGFSPPQHGLFAALFKILRQLCLLHTIFAKFSGVHKVLDSHHEQNRSERAEKIEDARELGRRILLAIKDPELFIRKYILGQRRGSPERKLTASILQDFQPEYYAAHIHLLEPSTE